jgi:hypothetical protein
VEFVARYLRHVLPRGLRSIRYYGFCHPAARAKRLRVQTHAGGPVQFGDSTPLPTTPSTCTFTALPVLSSAHTPPPPNRSLLPSAWASGGGRSLYLETSMKRPPANFCRARCRSPLSRRHPEACQTLSEPCSLALLRFNHRGSTAQRSSRVSSRLAEPSAASPILASLASALPAG